MIVEKPTQVTLAEAIRLIHRELVIAQAIREGDGVDPLFVVRSAEFELQITLSEERTSDGGTDVKVFAAKFGEKLDSQTSHRIKLTLDVHPAASELGLPGVFPNKSR